MISELFQKTTLKAYFTSIIISFLSVFFIHYCKNKGNLETDFFPKTFIFLILFLGIIFLISYLENKNSINTFRSIHLLSLPLVYLFFPHGEELVFIKVLIACIASIVVIILVLIRFIPGYKYNSN